MNERQIRGLTDNEIDAVFGGVEWECELECTVTLGQPPTCKLKCRISSS